jgi:hypothetical protein
MCQILSFAARLLRIKKITVVAALGKVSAKADRPDNTAYRCSTRSTPHCPSPTSSICRFLGFPHRHISTHRSTATDSSQQLHGLPSFNQVEVHSSERTGRLDGPWPSMLQERAVTQHVSGIKRVRVKTRRSCPICQWQEFGCLFRETPTRSARPDHGNVRSNPSFNFNSPSLFLFRSLFRPHKY